MEHTPPKTIQNIGNKPSDNHSKETTSDIVEELSLLLIIDSIVKVHVMKIVYDS